MKTHCTLLLLFFLTFHNSQQIADPEVLQKCRKEFNKKICLSDGTMRKLVWYWQDEKVG